MPIASSLLNKPKLVKKLRKFYEYVQKNDGKVGTKTRGIDLNFNNACNLRCKYCFTNSPTGDHAKDTLDLDMVASIADQADELGIFEFDLQGGELTLATIDESVRHALTKISRFHFVAGESFAKRVQQMGESKDRVFNVGSLGVDNLLSCPIMSFEQLNNTLHGSLKHPFAVGTFHPVTLIPDQTIPAARAMLESVLEHNIHLLLTGVNLDPGREILADVFNDYATRFSKQITYVESLGHVRYISAMNHCCFVIGNSSSGLIEAPAIPIPTINIGDRQRGRPSSPSVIDCAPEKDEIESAIKRILSSNFTDTLKSSDAAYGGKGAKDKIVDILKKISEDELRSPKQFEDYLIYK